ncbi:hypothetical protein GQ55_1G292000 [Panicum hallii var. hallii]|uniref:Uncharacterized protein n=1 Tax=Panicum hallii var. hallii TaxID=1504633 RepID=A0A2T7F8N9_9POAL|nr:hypothetical protein GQ55_1G292000 [Panicum hallii var. hallii]
MKSEDGGERFTRKVERRRDSSQALIHRVPVCFMLPSVQLCVYAIFYARQRFHVSESEIRNYKVICALASSPNKDQPAVKVKGVHCTFKSLGDSFKPGGVMSNFVISIFIRHLFYKPCGHPGVSKKHYFFSNIGVSSHTHIFIYLILFGLDI